MRTTNVKASQLNYDHYATSKYDRDIVNSIPHHTDLHKAITLHLNTLNKKKPKILDLGTGTGITAKLIQDLLPNAQIDVIDFSQKMLDGAKKKLGKNNVRYICGDYSKIDFDNNYDIIVSVIGLHHQNTVGKKKMFKLIYDRLVLDGMFIFGDLVTHKNKYRAALNNALHYKHLVDHATDKKTLAEWAHHHMFLNDLAPVEDQIEWLKKVGFKVQKKMLKMNTALLVCKK